MNATSTNVLMVSEALIDMGIPLRCGDRRVAGCQCAPTHLPHGRAPSRSRLCA